MAANANSVPRQVTVLATAAGQSSSDLFRHCLPGSLFLFQFFGSGLAVLLGYFHRPPQITLAVKFISGRCKSVIVAGVTPVGALGAVGIGVETSFE